MAGSSSPPNRVASDRDLDAARRPPAARQTHAAPAQATAAATPPGGLTLTGPLTAAAAPFGADDAPERLADGAAVLAGLIDLRGSVALAERLATIDAPLPVVEPADPAVVRATLHAGTTDIEARLDEAFAHAFRPRYRLPTPQRGWLIIERSGLLDAPRPSGRSRRRPKALRIAVRHLWAPLGEFLDTHLKRARFALRDLRAELEPRLLGLGEDAARLVQLDGALSEATSGATEKLLRRVGQAAERSFTDAVTAAWQSWPEPTTAEHFAAGFSPEGWLGDVLAEAQALYRAVVHHERSRLEALVESACALARDAGPIARRDAASDAAEDDAVEDAAAGHAVDGAFGGLAAVG